jgi:bile acid:Na+ symporter, BASS family
MEGNFLTKVVMPIALGVIMLGLGLGLTGADFRRIVVMPRPVLVGLFCQTVLLPAVCYGIAVGFGLPPELAVGLMLLAASPGGASANVFSHVAHGDVALNITLTATNSLLSLLTLPLIVGTSLRLFLGAEKNIPLPVDKVIQTFAIILVPVGIGMLVRWRKPALSDRLSKPVRTLAFVVLIIVIGGALYTEASKDSSKLLESFKQVGVPAAVFNVVSLGVGYLVPLALRLPKKQAIAIGMEIGIHNGTLAIAIATTVLSNPTMAIPPAIYSLIMFFTAAAFAFLVGRTVKDEPAPAEQRAA